MKRRSRIANFTKQETNYGLGFVKWTHACIAGSRELRTLPGSRCERVHRKDLLPSEDHSAAPSKPFLPDWKSIMACMISSRVFMTKGPC